MSLSLLPVVLVLTTLGVGWWIGDYNGIYTRVMQADVASASTMDLDDKLDRDLALLKEPQRRFRLHFQLGLSSALAVVLINSLSVTYLIGTSRWVKEVVEAYGLEQKFIDHSTKLKRATFPWSIISIFSIISIVAMGAAADPGTLRTTTANWVTPHLIAAMVGTSVIVVTIFVQAMNLHQNSQIIEEVVAEVKKERVARGLPVG